MNDWYARQFGDPCRDCGFGWSTTQAEADARLEGIAARCSEVLAGRDGNVRLTAHHWSATTYVWHMVDVLRIAAERVAATALGSRTPVVPWDENELARVRGYVKLPLESGLWALGRAYGDWREAVDLGLKRADFVMHHPERGTLSLADFRIGVAHELLHHEWDIRQALAV